MVWRASFPLQSLRDFKHPCTAVFPISFTRFVYSKYFHVDRSGDEEKFRARVCKFSVWKLAGYKNYTSFELEIHLTVYFFYSNSRIMLFLFNLFSRIELFFGWLVIAGWQTSCAFNALIRRGCPRGEISGKYKKSGDEMVSSRKLPHEDLS